MNFESWLSVFFVILTSQVVAQNSTITITSPASISTDPGRECYGTYAGGPCVTASYIFTLCLYSNTGLDDLWGCWCSNGYDKAWSRCNSCENHFSTTRANVDATSPYIASCSSILSALSSARAASTTATSSTDSASKMASASSGGTTPAPTAASTTRSEGTSRAAQRVYGIVLFVFWVLLVVMP